MRNTKIRIGLAILGGLLLAWVLMPTVEAGPSTMFPENGENIRDNTPVFQWSLVTGTEENYRIVICRDSGGAPNPSDNIYDNWLTENIDNFDTHPENALPDNLWWWGVRVENTEGDPATTDEWTWYVLRIDTLPPAAPALLSPADGENLRDNTPTLVWQNVDENSLPVVYTVEVDNEDTFTSPLTLTVENRSTSGNSSVTLPALPDNLYYWRVKARDNAGNENVSETRSFRIDTLPPAAPSDLRVSPDGWTNVNSFTLTWTNPPENSGVVTAYYKFDSPPSDPSDRNGEAPATGENIGDLQLPGEGVRTIYLWLVDGAGNVGVEWSSVQAKLDLHAPQAPSVSSTFPEGTPINQNAPSFSWTEVGGPSPVTYLYKLEGYDQDWKTTSGTSVSYSGLSTGDYVFKVKARDTGGESEVTSYRIIVDITPPTMELTMGGAAGVSLTETGEGWTGESSTDTIRLTGRVGPGTRMTINGRPVAVSGEGYFDVTLTLAAGLNVFRVRLMDPAGNITERTLTINYSAPAPQAPSTEWGPVYLAFGVIAVILVAAFLFLRRP